MKLTKRELATVLVSLRTFQEWPSTGMEHFKSVRPLSATEIDELCERLNCEDVLQGAGPRKKERLKIVVHIEEGIVQGVYANVRKTDVEVYDTDPEFSGLAKEKRDLKRAIRGLTEVRE